MQAVFLANRSRLGLARARIARGAGGDVEEARGLLEQVIETARKHGLKRIESDALGLREELGGVTSRGEPPPGTFLAGLSTEQREALERWPRRRFAAGDVIIEQGQQGAGVYVLLDGSAEGTRRPDRRASHDSSQ